MQKTPDLFDRSNEILKSIEFTPSVLPNVAKGDFWWYVEGMNIGQEISKDGTMKRPCLIYRAIPHSSLIRILPLTTKIMDKPHQLFLTKRSKHGFRKPSSILIYQLKCIDKKRLVEKIRGQRASPGLIDLIQSKQI